MSQLTYLQELVLDLFSQSPLKDKFYWSGGTALSVVYLHHRKSEDLDFFSDESFSHSDIINFLNNLKIKTGLKFIEEKKIFDRWNFFLHNHEEVRLEFVHYEHPRLGKRGKWQQMSVDSLDDIAANKLMALFDRNEPKDAIDLYYILTKGKYEIGTILKFVQKKFGVKFEESAVWGEALKGAKDIKELKPLLIGKDSQEVIEKFFATKSKKYLEQVLK